MTAENQRGIRQNRRWIEKKNKVNLIILDIEGQQTTEGGSSKLSWKHCFCNSEYFILTKQLGTSLINYISFALSPIFQRNFLRDLFATPRVTCHTSGAIFLTLFQRFSESAVFTKPWVKQENKQTKHQLVTEFLIPLTAHWHLGSNHYLSS